MRATFATDLDELQAWFASVAQLPRFLRTKDARALWDDLEKVELTSFEDVAVRIGRSADTLRSQMRRCPFGI